MFLTILLQHSRRHHVRIDTEAQQPHSWEKIFLLQHHAEEEQISTQNISVTEIHNTKD